MLFRQFSNITIYVRVVGKMHNQHFIVLLFSNPGDKVQKRWKIIGQMCPLLSKRIMTLSPGFKNNDALKYWSGIFPTTQTYVAMLENCQNNISMYDCSPIQGQDYNLWWNPMKPGYKYNHMFSLFCAIYYSLFQLSNLHPRGGQI